MKKPRISLELSREQKSKNPDENPEYQGADFELGNQCQINVPFFPGESNLGARLDPPGSPQAIGSQPPKLADLQLLESRARDLGDRGVDARLGSGKGNPGGISGAKVSGLSQKLYMGPSADVRSVGNLKPRSKASQKS